MIAALDEADEAVPRAEAVAGGRTPRHKWSNAFADGCARMIANEMRRQVAFKNFHILPGEGGRSEPRTFAAGGKRKSVDVVVSSLVSGLQVGVSLKGMNFRDSSGLQFDKNLTGRTYELQDEVRVVHEYQPAALLVGLYFMPIAATVDKRGPDSPSAFARTVEHLRARTGRLDPTLPSQLSKIDVSVVALYVPGDRETKDDEILYEDTLERGVVRYFDVSKDPPRRGRPRIETTMDLAGFVDVVASRYVYSDHEPIEWAEPEPD
ncbi:MAG: hypothetical protein ACQEXJ_22440 [Myxococcota bacterium]